MNKGCSESSARAWVYGLRMLAAQASDPVIAWEGKWTCELRRVCSRRGLELELGEWVLVRVATV